MSRNNKTTLRFLCAVAALWIWFAPAAAFAEDSDPATTMMQMDAMASKGSKDFLPFLHSYLANPTEPQDIDPKLYKDFWLKWELVTTRYKPDGNELRFIYANDIGAKALAKGKYPFPEGTMFAKIAAQGVHDPIFDNSLVPGPINRVQIMLKKKNDPNARDGWVYSAYVPGNIMGHLTKNQIEACQVCHQVAKKRDMVFAQPFPVPGGASPAKTDAGFLPDETFKDTFQKTAVTKLPENTRKIVSSVTPDTNYVQYRSMPAFGGTLFESREVLAGFALVDKQTYALDSPNGEYILVAVPYPDKACARMISVNKNMFVTLSPKTGDNSLVDTSQKIDGPPISWDLCPGEKNAAPAK